MEKRLLIGIVTARVTAPEQKQLLSGILDRAAALGMDTVVISNLYNFEEYFAHTEIENRIYDLIPSPRIDGLIIMSEPFLHDSTWQYIRKRIRKRNIPVVVTGDKLPELCSVDNDVEADFELLTRHLTEQHHISDIDFLTGQKEQETSQLRVKGCRNALREKGLVLPEEHVIYGNFWTNAGEELAMRYINGERRLPQAIICANDYMAFGLCDTFLERGIRVPEDVTVIGYEYIGERSIHAPTLTTFLRNRRAVGMKAVELLDSMLTGREPEEIPTTGEIICGNSCSCGMNHKQLSQELAEMRRTNFYLQLHYHSNFEQQLTSCRSILDYIHVLQEFAYLIRDAAGIYLCLYEDWCSSDCAVTLETENPDAFMLCYRVISPENGTDKPVVFRREQIFPDTLPGSGATMHLYLAPVFFAGREMGYFIVQYQKPDSYDASFGDWMKMAANALETLRMKNDIRTLLECRNLSEFHDTSTGLYNARGLSHELSLAVREAAPEERLLLVLARTALFSDNTSIDGRSDFVRMEVQLAGCLQRLTGGAHEFCAKLSDSLFAIACVGCYDEEQLQLLTDKLDTLILHAPLYSKYQGLGTFTVVSGLLPTDLKQAEAQSKALYSQLQAQTETLSAARSHSSYSEFQTLRSSMYRSPQNNWDAQTMCREFHQSYGHFRATYKELFGISFHQDLIQSRISLAKHLLLTSSLSLQSIAFQCGYEDDKYFLRQFRKLTGKTPNYYRNA